MLSVICVTVEQFQVVWTAALAPAPDDGHFQQVREVQVLTG
jgi:hypothetical protein